MATVNNTTSVFSMDDGDVGDPVVNEDVHSPGGFGTQGLWSDTQERRMACKAYLFEISHEVARKSGGIYTVLSSKALVTVKEWGDRYALIGPYIPASAALEFDPLPPTKFAGELISTLKQKHGIIVHFGRWLVKGYPRCFLIDPKSSAHNLGMWRHDLQQSVANENDAEANEAIIFGYQVAHFFAELTTIVKNRAVIAHFHEWLAAVGLIVMKRWNIKAATLFTTHATLLGRYMAAGGMDLYQCLQTGINADNEAGRRQIYNRHWIEVGAARGADVFTTVSDITSFEASKTLGRVADVVTPNGLNSDRFIAVHQFQNLHKQNKDKISEFVRGHFYGSYDFDLENTLYFFTAGRREYRNKGVDLMVEALADLNFQLKREGSKTTVVAFIIMPGNTNNYNVESIKGQSVRRQIRETCDTIVSKISERMYEKILRGEMPDLSHMASEEDIVNIKRRVQMVSAANRVPPIVTHNMVNDPEDEVLCHLRACRLFNAKEDRVKVVYHPEFVSATSAILPLDYADFVRGCHLGIFVSYYEPWGYTPAECALSGIPSVTSNLAGFANYMQRRLPDPEQHGIYIIDRRNKSFSESKDQLSSALWRFCNLTQRQRIEQRNLTEKLSEILDWTSMHSQYSKARALAVKKVYGFDLPTFA